MNMNTNILILNALLYVLLHSLTNFIVQVMYLYFVYTMLPTYKLKNLMRKKIRKKVYHMLLYQTLLFLISEMSSKIGILTNKSHTILLLMHYFFKSAVLTKLVYLCLSGFILLYWTCTVLSQFYLLPKSAFSGSS